ncbi:TonB-dependent receptor [Sphingopyxis sp. BSN-002]|uniref:TonB-dependent receptor plug domain-containing protein n=1 Tax=Sphingopyxis sp. BSN-002 TaxID=2911495 RepID=UPI001ED9D9C8|nr:TonB-dependent receptor [Sphingopyxis sp. BSN-002]UKK85242.1 TonB-dependent receptor [Sphingopyxis sp. BSN-002]
MKTRILTSTLSLIAVAAATPAFAQESVTGSEDSTITVIGAPLAADESNASVSVIDGTDIRRAQNGSVSDQLVRLPGVSFNQNGTLGGVTNIRIRGAEAEQTLVLIDGVRVGDPSSPGGGFDFANLMLGNIDRVEVLRGANSLPWGSHAIGGVVAVTTTNAGAAEAGATSGQIGAEYGARDTVRANGQLRTSLGASQFGIGGGYTRTDGISSAAVGTERDGYRQYSLNLTNRTEIGNTLVFRAFGLYADSRVDLDGFSFSPPYGLIDTNEFQKTREHYAAATIEHRPGGNDSTTGFSHKLQFGFADVNRDNYNPDFGTAPSFTARGRNERLSYSIDWAAIAQLRVLAGAEREWTHAFTDDGFAADNGKTATTSFWGMLVGKPTETLSLTAGIRHDDHRDFGGATTLAFDAGQKIGDLVTIRASYREGFKAPTLFQLSDSAGAYGNPDLAPERARSYEIGLRFGDGQQWFLDVAAFRRNSRNLIDFVTCPTTPNPLPAICATGNRPFGTYDNILRARGEGFEVEGGAKIGEQLELNANYTLLSVKDRTPGGFYEGNRLARRPRHLANAELAWTPGGALDGADLSVAVRYAGKSFDDRFNSVELDDYVLVDLRASYPVYAGIELFGRVENLFDEDYQTAAGYGTAGRSAYVGVRWGF